MIFTDRTRSFVLEQVTGWVWEQRYDGPKTLIVFAGVKIGFVEPDAGVVERWLRQQLGPTCHLGRFKDGPTQVSLPQSEPEGT